MKKILTLAGLAILAFSVFAQVPEKVSYQAVIRNSGGDLVVSHSVGILISILHNSPTGDLIYTEAQTSSTNENGLLSIVIGSLVPLGGIDWSDGTYYIKTDVDPSGGTVYSISGTSQLLSVPYALYAAAAETARPDGNNPGDMLYWNGTSWLLLPAGQPGQFLQFAASNRPQWSGPLFSTITTDAASSIRGSTATSGGNITSDGGASVTARGVCWSESANPTIMDSKTTDGTGTGTFASSITGLTPLTEYFARAYATNNAGTAYGNEILFTTTSAIAPTMSTAEVTIISPTSSASGGSITDDGGAEVTARGVCWSETTNPTIALETKTEDGAGAGAFISTMTGLTQGTTYYVRAYATNVAGTSYGNELNFEAGKVKDIDGNVYNTVAIGTQLWMVENLKSTKYNNGESIGTTEPHNLDISGETDPKYQWAYNGNEDNAAIYGRLYTWFTVTDSRGVCPDGWHVPTHAEWTTLEDYLIANGYNYDGTITGNKIAKSLGSATLWQASGTVGAIGNTGYPEKINVTGFTSVPTGYRHPNLSIWYYLGQFGHLWTVTEYDGESGWFLSTCYAYNYTVQGGGLKKAGFAVRCLKD